MNLDARSTDCPVCGAAAGSPCLFVNGQARSPHLGRIRKARTLTPPPNRPDSTPVENRPDTEL